MAYTLVQPIKTCYNPFVLLPHCNAHVKRYGWSHDRHVCNDVLQRELFLCFSYGNQMTQMHWRLNWIVIPVNIMLATYRSFVYINYACVCVYGSVERDTTALSIDSINNSSRVKNGQHTVSASIVSTTQWNDAITHDWFSLTWKVFTF